MPLRAAVLLNRSCRAADDPVADTVAKLLRAAPLDAVIEQVRGDDMLDAARRAVQSGRTLLVAAGGDGTVNTVASVAAAHDAVLGVLPLGTLNHFARDAGIPHDLESAVATLTSERVASIDIGEVNGHVFVNNSSLGAYPRLVFEREQQQRHGRRKWTAFAVAALHVWRQYRRITVHIEGRSYRRNVRTPFVFVGNNEYAISGGRIDARSSLNAGHLQICMAPDASRMQATRIVLAAMTGHLAGVEGFEALLATELTIGARPRRLGVSLDGELRILDSPLRYRIRPQALRVMVPAQKDPR